MANKIQLKRGLKSKLPTLSSGEVAYTTDTRELYVGTGSGNVNVTGGGWYTGTSMSGTSTTTGAYSYSSCPMVKVGDLYLNTYDGYVYRCTTAGSGSSAKWTYQGSIRGPIGNPGPKGEEGDDLNCVYSTTRTYVGNWIDSQPIYRVVWAIPVSKVRMYTDTFMYNIEDIVGDLPTTNCPIPLDCAQLISERYLLKGGYGNRESCVVTDRFTLAKVVTDSTTSYGKDNYTVYCILEYIE